MAPPSASASLISDPSRPGCRSRRPRLGPRPSLLPENRTDDVKRAFTDLLIAAAEGDVPLAQGLAIELGRAGMSVDEAVAAFDVRGRSRCRPLHAAAITGQAQMCRFLIRSCEVDVNAVDGDGETPLICAIQGSASTDIVRYLLNRGADPNKANDRGITPLHVAAERGSLGCMELLIEFRADVNAGSAVTPLLMAAGKGLTHCIRCLLEAGADANLPDEDGKVPVEIAALQGWEDCVKILFPVTSPLPEYADWSIDGIIQHGKL